MKNLKQIKLLLIVIMLTMSAESFSQTFGVKAGLNLSNVLMKDDDDTYSDDFKMNPGFHVGATAEFPINDMISFETGLLFTTKGFKWTEKGTDYTSTEKLNVFYIDLPLTAKAYFDVGSVRIYGVFGPYIGAGISGKYIEKYEETGQDTETNTDDVKWGSDKDSDDLKRLDFGLTAGAGVEINSIQIGVSYGFGLANISSYTEGGNKISNRVLGLSVGFKFGR